MTAPDPAQHEPAGSPLGPPSVGDISIAGFSGPVDVLLDRLRSRSYDIAALSIHDVVDFICQEVARSDVPTRLSTKAGWVVAAATITLLKSRLLLPAGHPDLDTAESEAREIQERLIAREQIARATDDLISRWSTGPATYARGDLVLKRSLRGPDDRPSPHSRRARGSAPAGSRMRETFELLQGCLSASKPRHLPVEFRPQWLDLCRSAQAHRWLVSRLDQIAPETPLQDLTRDMAASEMASSTRRLTELHARAYVASMFAASLELAKAGDVQVTQTDGPVSLSPTADQKHQAPRAS